MKKQLWTGLVASIGMLVLILDSKTALTGAQQGVELCIRTVIPSLFPFFILSAMLTGSLIGTSSPLLRPLGRLFQLPKGAESLLVAAFLGGYPVGAQSVTQAWKRGQLSKQDAQRLLSFSSNAGPAFLFGMVGAMFSRKWMVWLLWAIHIFSAWLVSFLFPPDDAKAHFGQEQDVSLTAALTASVKTMAQVCGWVVLFRVVITFLNRWILWLLPAPWQVALIGILELSNGCCELYAVANERLRFLICSGILAFGGLCVTMQTLSVTRGLSLRYYLAGKLLQTLFSVALSAAVLYQLWYLAVSILLVFLIIPRKTQKRYSIPRKAVV